MYPKTKPSAKSLLLPLSVAILVLCLAAPSATALPPDDACALLTPAQVGAAAGSTPGPGTYVTPDFKRTCTWTLPNNAGLVTLFIMAPGAFESGRTLAAGGAVITPLSGVGDDAYYLAVGPAIGLGVKKGSVTFKVTLYGAGFPMEKKQAVEKALAQQVVPQL